MKKFYQEPELEIKHYSYDVDILTSSYTEGDNSGDTGVDLGNDDQYDIFK